MDAAEDEHTAALRILLQVDESNADAACLTARVVHSLGSIHARRGSDLDEARRWYNEALARKRRLLLEEKQGQVALRCTTASWARATTDWPRLKLWEA